MSAYLAGHHRQPFAGGPGWYKCCQYVEDLSLGHMLLLGWVLSSGKWHVAKDTAEHSQAFEMLHNFGSNHLRLDNLYTIRVGRGIGSAPKLPGYA